ncbi:MAG TPA: helix-turn-helix domain-containing protein [Candidatus Limnocylindria bacterium]|nr:helix-turn-helix domain-containing protein [Candidatus Limnocylindria bacterium]
MPDLTRRERQVLERVCRGLSTKAIAAELGVSDQAVKAHLSRLFLKFGVANRTGLVAVAVAEAERRRTTADRDAHTAELQRRVAELTARNADLESANQRLRTRQDPAEATAAD